MSYYMYTITDYTRNQANKLGVQVKPSTNPKKKIDVFKNDKKIASIGAKGYMDFPSYVKKDGIEYANERRKLYRARHKKDLSKGNGYWSGKLLW